MSGVLKLSIITVVRDDLIGFSETFESLQAQKLMPDEWVIVDSSDSEEIIQYLENFIGINYVYKKVPAKGIYNAMNIGLIAASGSFVWFLNAGDTLCTSETHESVKHQIVMHPHLDLCAFAVLYLTASNFIFDVVFPRVLVKTSEVISAVHHQGALINRKKALEIGGFDESLKYAADGKFLDILVAGNNYVLNDIPVVYFRMGGASARFYRSINDEMRQFRQTASDHVNSYLILKNFIRNIVARRHDFFVTRKLIELYLSRRESITLDRISFR